MRNLKEVLELLDIGYTQPVQPVLFPKAIPGLSDFASSMHHRSPTQRRQQSGHDQSTGPNLGNAGSSHGSSNDFMTPPGGTITSGGSTFS